MKSSNHLKKQQILNTLPQKENEQIVDENDKAGDKTTKNMRTTDDGSPNSTKRLLREEKGGPKSRRMDNHGRKKRSQSSQSKRSLFDKICVPQYFIGKTFGCLFHSFLVDEKAIAIALYRTQMNTDQRSQAESDDSSPRNSFQGASGVSLPFVITAPATETILQFRDEVFLLRGAS